MSAAVLTILDGLQAGLQTRLAGGNSLIGTGTDCAVVLADPAMQSDHFEILVGKTTSLRARNRIELADGLLVECGSQILLSGPTSFTAGQTRFLVELSGSQPALRARSSPRRSINVAMRGTAIALAGIALVACWRLAARHAIDAPPVAVAGRAVRGPLPAPGMDRAAMIGALRARLAGAGLGGVSVSAQSDGTVLAQGSLGGDDEVAWDAVRQWFDTRYGNAVVVVERFGEPVAPPPLRIAAVWAGPHPYVVDDRGNRLHPGASVGDGWFLEGISNGRALVRRGSQTIALKYDP